MPSPASLHNESGGHVTTMSKDQQSGVPRVTVVTVTHGDRWSYLSEVLRFAEATSGISDVIVVDNGAHTPIAPLVEREGFQKAAVVRNPSNQGSAAAYKRGLEIARDRGAGWIWLLDDDNMPESNALDIMLAAAGELSESQLSDCAFLSFRPALQADIAAGVDVSRCYPPHSSFCGFHIADIPFKIWRRGTRWRSRAKEPVAARLALPYATFGGLFLHRKLVEKIGTPDETLVLYADDTEFSNRIVQAGGKIWLLTGAIVRELESSWSSKTSARSSFERWLQRGTDFQVFYNARNRAYFDRRFWSRNAAMYQLNRFIYLLALRMFAKKNHAEARYDLFRNAITLGESGRLGFNKDYPLL